MKEIDSNDDLWLDMVTQPWQTDEQYAMTLQTIADYESFMHNIFSQELSKARRRPVGHWGNYCKKYFTGYAGMMPSRYSNLCRKIKFMIASCLPESVFIRLKKLLGRI